MASSYLVSYLVDVMKKLDSELDILRGMIVEMAGLAEQMLEKAVEAISLPEQSELVAKVHKWESRMDELEVEIDKLAVRLLTVYGPVAHDLRFVVSASRINSELERIGDNTVNVCESIKLLTRRPGSIKTELLKDLGKHVRKMVSATVLALTESDHDRARQTIAMDDKIDSINEQIVADQLESTDDLSGTIAQVLIARSLERVADQCTNVCEEIVFLAQGDDIRHQPLELPIVDATAANAY